MGSLIAMLGLPMEASAVLGQEFGRRVRVLAGNVLNNHYRCKDDKWIVIAHLQPDKYWPKVCKALGVEEIRDDPRFGSIAGRAEHAAELVAIFDVRFATKTRAEWMRILREEGCICTPVQSAIEVSRDPQAAANNYFIGVEHPEWVIPRWSAFHGISAEPRLPGPDVRLNLVSTPRKSCVRPATVRRKSRHSGVKGRYFETNVCIQNLS
jgi:crotonobetainyl-CoA:carnitine CoA-transferase CaiB-like acyl-CoA transferase